MKLVVWKIYLGGQIFVQKLGPSYKKNGVKTIIIDIHDTGMPV